MENDLPPIHFRSNIRKWADLHSWQKGGTGSGTLWCQRQGISNPARTGWVGSLLFPVLLPGIDAWMAFSWASFFFFSLFFFFFSFYFFFLFLNTTSYAVPFAQMHNTNYILSHPRLLFQYKIILCSKVGKFQTPFGFGPTVWGKKGLSVFKSFYNVYKRCAPLLSKSF